MTSTALVERARAELVGWDLACWCRLPEFTAAMAIVDGLRRGELRAITLSAVRAALSAERTGDAEHLVQFGRDLLATVQLRSIPAHVRTLEIARAAPAESGDAVDITTVLARLIGNA
ncbi:hypothetical protein ACFV1N_46055 [Streptosporangium canum]|uniref:hypothetical protein n=1 Tax=Streptosporangium canum TaxID=324952 RepID=UPI0036BDEEF2